MVSVLSPSRHETPESLGMNRSRPWALLAVIVLCLFGFLLVKAESNSPHSNALFYMYGLAVTSVVLMQMTIAFFFYRDPYRKALESMQEQPVAERPSTPAATRRQLRRHRRADATRHVEFEPVADAPGLWELDTMSHAPRHAMLETTADAPRLWELDSIVDAPRLWESDTMAHVPRHALLETTADAPRLWELDTIVDAPRPLVTCLVAVYNDEFIISDCLRSVCNQTYPNIEVIVVNDASTDGTQRMLDELAEQLPIKVLELKDNVGKKAALVRGASLARGEIFAFTDSDSIWDPFALDRIVTAMQANPDLGAVSGHCRARNANETFFTKVQDTWYEGQFAVRKAFESTFGAVTCVSGPLAVFRREAIYNLLPAWARDRFLGDSFRFATDRTLTGYVLGAQQVTKRLIAKTDPDSEFLAYRYPIRKWKVAYCKSAKAWTQVPDTLSAVLRQQVRWKKSFLRNIFLTGRFYWRRPIPPASVYYLHILFVIAGPFVAFRHMIYLPLHGNMTSMLMYIFGITVIGSAFAFAHKAEEPTSTGWVYRPLMSFFSTLVLSWLIFYSVATIKKMKWSRA
jgi:cellulose synthase/poly-beta-1,6-N-acetylglucosamine synthase-like glycosyltransferase